MVQMAASDGGGHRAEPPHDPPAPRLVRRGDHRHRRRRDRVRRRALDRRGLPRGDGRGRVAEPRDHHAERRRLRDDERHRRNRGRHHQGGARTAPATATRRSPPPSCTCSSISTSARPAPRRTCPCAASSRPPSRYATSVDHRRGPPVPLRHERGDRRPRGEPAVRRRGPRLGVQVGRPHAEDRRDLHGEGVGRRDGDLVRQPADPGRLPARQLVPVGAGQARLVGVVRRVQGLAHDQPAAERAGAARDGVLRRAVAGHDEPHPRHRLHDRRTDGHRARSSAPSSRCTRPCRRARARSPRCARSGSTRAPCWFRS